MRTNLNIIDNPSPTEWNTLCLRPQIGRSDLFSLCESVFEEVRCDSDEALIRFTNKFDGVKLDSVLASPQEIEESANLVSTELKLAINQAYSNIYRFHKVQVPVTVEVETSPGVVCREEYRAIDRVGLYIPGGSATLFSTLLMLAIPAQLAGVEELVLTTPPLKNGKLPAAIAYVVQLCGVHKVLKLGGIQAIAALSLGTSQTKPVYKIAGPGNQYVMAAKEYAVGLGIAIDLPAGPSEVLIIADKTADPAFVASDLLSQAEHGEDSQVVLLTTDKIKITEVFTALEKLLNTLSRKEIIAQSLKSARFIYFETIGDCIQFSNTYAPEHLILAVNQAREYAGKIRNAGSVFLGHWSPESAGDYASGTNHTLPTNGFARNYGGVSVTSFMKKITFQELSPQGISLLAPTIEVMANAEGLDAHALAAKLRREKGGNYGI